MTMRKATGECIVVVTHFADKLCNLSPVCVCTSSGMIMVVVCIALVQAMKQRLYVYRSTHKAPSLPQGPWTTQPR